MRLVQLESVCLNRRVRMCVCVCVRACGRSQLAPVPGPWSRGALAGMRPALLERRYLHFSSLHPAALPSELNSRTLPRSAPFVPTRHPPWMRLPVFFGTLQTAHPPRPSVHFNADEKAAESLSSIGVA